VTDLRRFTALSESMEPAAVMELLSRVQGRLAEEVRRRGGTVDKFMGDGMLAVFGAPEALEDHAGAALAAAREMVEAVRGMGLALGVGVHTGPVVAGCLGSGARLEFTVLGDTVNTASRLQDLTKEVGAPLCASGDTVTAAGGAERHGLLERGEIALRGRAAPVRVFVPQ
jgi:class 3 adenylate cyclase